MKSIPYYKFPENVKFFLKSYFKVSEDTLLPLYISFEKRPENYPSFVCAEFIPPSKIAYYKNNIRWGGIIHDATHFLQYQKNSKEFEKNRKLTKEAILDNKYVIYRENPLEKEANEAQEEFKRYSELKLSWQLDPLPGIFDYGKGDIIKVENEKFTHQETPVYWIYDMQTGVYKKTLNSLEEISEVYGIAPSHAKRAIESNTGIKGVYIIEGREGEKKSLKVKPRLDRETELRGKKIIGINPLTGNEYTFNSAREAERELQINRSSIIHVLKGRQNSAGGWKWRYAEGEKNEESIGKNKWTGRRFTLKGSTLLEVIDIKEGETPIIVMEDKNTGKVFNYTPQSFATALQEGILIKESTVRVTANYFADDNRIESVEKVDDWNEKHKDLLNKLYKQKFGWQLLENKYPIVFAFLEDYFKIHSYSNTSKDDIIYELATHFNLDYEEAVNIYYHFVTYYWDKKSSIKLSWMLKSKAELIWNNMDLAAFWELIPGRFDEYEGKDFKELPIEVQQDFENLIETSESIQKVLKMFGYPFNDKISSKDFNSYKDQNVSLYRKRLNYYDENEGANIFWSSRDAQEKRFKVLTDIGDLEDTEILDVGCGYCDLLTYLKQKDINPKNYVGVDIVPEIVKKAKELHPNINIQVRDIQEEPLEENSFDYVFGSGIFALQDQNWQQYVVNMLKEMLKIARKGVAVNFLKEINIKESSRKLSWNLDESIYAFEDQLRNQNISFYRKGDTYIINDRGDVFLDSLTSLPNNIEFNNRGYVFLNSLTSLPNNIEFNNRGGVNLFSLTSLPNNIVFNNEGYVNLSSLTSLPNNIEFNNRGNVYLDLLTSLPNNILFNNRGSVFFNSLTSLPDNIVFNNRGSVFFNSLTSLPDNIVFNNRGDVYLHSLISLPENKYEIFKNGGKVYYNNLNSIFNPHQKESKLSWQLMEDFPRIKPGRETHRILKYIANKGEAGGRTSRIDKALGIPYQSRTNLEKRDFLIIYKGEDGYNWTKLSLKGYRLLDYLNNQEEISKESNITQLMYVNPNFTYNFIRNFVSNKVELKENYLEDDFTIFIYKE